MTFGRLFGALGEHLDALRDALEKGGILGAGWLATGTQDLR